MWDNMKMRLKYLQIKFNCHYVVEQNLSVNYSSYGALRKLSQGECGIFKPSF